ncbi:divalent-cation tolerance protein CutA [Sedimenticola selenatireducens]|jgi:periplasmic divalent cation tolerance protein|uniref:Divalent-cation tolerance protein CutA n=1 Tax=Sedimenticola selenatireducens TaxID=191960 RepID=A0A557SGS9_9GAMM|nr:divalent-cation tolerance protein CutA [Sedimenticola selenatireducens]TVO76591.1 divalent-cation tolerance protein CutA [Sedimenticola selenatireducens]TVT64035.1 MAG: divalent-cation tolerance protein CutA [Sedimenticola selenatireducens]
MSVDKLLIYCTCPDRASADRIAGHLVTKRLAACVSITAPVTSIYTWQDKLETAEEHLLLIKTSQSRYAELEQAILSVHPYELPEIIAVPIERGLPSYLHWIDECIEQQD